MTEFRFLRPCKTTESVTNTNVTRFLMQFFSKQALEKVASNDCDFIKTSVTNVQAKADLHFQQLKVKFLLKSSVLPQNRVGLGLLLSRRNLIFNLTAFWPNLTFNYYESSFYYSIGGI